MDRKSNPSIYVDCLSSFSHSFLFFSSFCYHSIFALIILFLLLCWLVSGRRNKQSVTGRHRPPPPQKVDHFFCGASDEKHIGLLLPLVDDHRFSKGLLLWLTDHSTNQLANPPPFSLQSHFSSLSDCTHSNFSAKKDLCLLGRNWNTGLGNGIVRTKKGFVCSSDSQKIAVFFLKR